ncbi:hypothetical protein Noda2021_01270 [Candidatus Dependentiae bacterium Noda2021]|nr:hypothetical protein Noda2021_01270 [Candidatus Dependentiae bacterium Noda2021]
MYDLNSLIAILFRIINFLVFVGLGIYFFKKKMLKATQQKINEKEVYLKSLQEQDRMLNNQFSSLEDVLKKQEEKCASLTEKVVQWKVAQTHQAAKKLQKRNAHLKTMHERLELKEEYINQQRFEQAAVLEALKKTKEDLEQHFSKDAAGQSYMHTILKAIDKE